MNSCDWKPCKDPAPSNKDHLLWVAEFSLDDGDVVDLLFDPLSLWIYSRRETRDPDSGENLTVWARADVGMYHDG